MSTLSDLNSVVSDLQGDRTRMMLLVLDNLIWPILLIAFVFFSLLLPQIFTQYQNVEFLLYTSAGLGAIALAEGICLISGNFDLSVGSVAGFSSMFAALFLTEWFPGTPGIVGVLVLLAVGGGIGFLNGFFIAEFDVNPFLQTLSTFIIFEGGILVLSSRSVYGLPESYLWLGGGDVSIGGLLPQSVPVAVFFMLSLFVAVWFMLTKTRFGRSVYAVGGDEESAAEAGIDTSRVVIVVFVLSGMLSATGGLLLTGFNNGATPTLGTSQLFPAFTAAVIGGISLFGGRGNVLNALGGVLLLSTIAAGLVMLNIDPQIVQAINGIVLFSAILMYTSVQRVRERLLADL